MSRKVKAVSSVVLLLRKDIFLDIIWKHLRLRRYELLALALITLAIVLRLILIANSWPQTSSEEGTTGLEAMHIAYRGEFPIFMYGLNYLGALEAYLGAILFHLFGVSLFSLRLGMIIFFALFLLCMYYLTTLLYSPPMALVTLAVLSLGSTWVPLFVVAVLVIGLFPLIAYNVTALPGRDSLSTFQKLYNNGGPTTPDPHFIQKQLSGTFLSSLPVATGMDTLCDVRDMPFFGSTPPPIGCTLLQGGWSLGYLLLLTIATCMAVRGVWKLRKVHATNMLNWPVEDRRLAILYIAQLMLLLSAAITIFLFAHSPNSASRPWSTRYLIGLLVATPAVLWPLWNGISTRISTFPGTLRFKHFTALFRYSILLLLILLFATEMLLITTEIPSIEASNAQDKAITSDLLHLGVNHIYSGYWECDRFIFLTQEKIICGVVTADMSARRTRYAAYYTIVHSDPKASYVFHQDSIYEKNFEKKIAQFNKRFQKIVLDGYVVYRPKN